MCLVRKGLVPPTHLRHVAKIPGRALHVRIQMQVPIDIMCVYQVAWNPGRMDLPKDGKIEALIRQRRKLWNLLDQWLRSTPQRGGTLIAGDLNVYMLRARNLPWTWPTPRSRRLQGTVAEPSLHYPELLATSRCAGPDLPLTRSQCPGAGHSARLHHYQRLNV